METPENKGQTETGAAPEDKFSSDQFNVGSVLSRTFATLMKSPAAFIGLTLIAVVPPAIIEGLLPINRVTAGAMNIVGSILTLVIEGAIAYVVFQSFRGNTASIGDAFSRGMSRLGPLVAASFLTGLGIGVGTLLFVIPGIILMCLWAVTIPACAVEKLGAIDSMKRSAALTKGFRLKIFALVLVVSVVIMVVAGGLMFILVKVSNSYLLISLISALVVTIPQAFYCVMIAIIYYDLREIKEGVAIDSLANVFD